MYKYDLAEPLARDLSDAEEIDFKEYAKKHDPFPGTPWKIYHPVCRKEWLARGLTPSE